MRKNLSLLSMIPLAWAVAGCGGGGGSSPDPEPNPKADGQALVAIKWPASGRLIPLAANSVQVVLKAGGVAVSTKTLSRPAAGGTTTATFDGLKYGSYTVDVKAYPTTDAQATDSTAVAQGVGAGTLQIVENQIAKVDVAMASTVTKLVLTPDAPSFPKGTSTVLTVSARDAAGAIVLLAAGGGTEQITWSGNNSTNVSIVPNGLTATITGVHSGTAGVMVSFVRNDAGAKVVATTTTTVTVVDDGTGSVIIH